MGHNLLRHCVPKPRPRPLLGVRWLNETEGFAGGYIGARVLRTTDGGKTWTDARLPGDPMIYSVFTRGDSAWVCGSSGEIFRSDDRAKTWSRVPSPFDSDDRCWSLSFDATRKGEASGMNGSRWVTDNDGATWTVVEAAKGPNAERTNVPGSQSGRASQQDQETITLDGQMLVFDQPGKPRRAHPLLSKPSGERTPLLGVATRASGQLGWTAKALFFSDENETWYSVSTLPAVPTRLTYLNAKTIVLEGRAGVFRSDSAGREWKRSEQPEFDHSDAEQATTKVFARNPIACVATAQRADLKFETNDCGGHGRGVGGSTESIAGAESGYSRALAIHELLDLPGSRVK